MEVSKLTKGEVALAIYEAAEAKTEAAGRYRDGEAGELALDMFGPKVVGAVNEVYAVFDDGSAFAWDSRTGDGLATTVANLLAESDGRGLFYAEPEFGYRSIFDAVLKDAGTSLEAIARYYEEN
jgi:hypothetical protein